MKYLIVLFALSLSSCSFFQEKSEEAINLNIDTASMLKGRSIESHILINNSENSEAIKK